MWARAGAEIASAANAAAIGFDFDFDDLGVFLIAAWREGLATARASGLFLRQDAFFGEDGQVGIVPAFGNGVAVLLAPFSPRLGSDGGGRRSSLARRGVLGERVLGEGGLGLIGRVTRLAFRAVEALVEDA